MHSLILTVVVASLAFAQVPEPTISRDAISIHRVQRGTMPLREIASGSITSTEDPVRAILSLARSSANSLRVGQTASIQIKPPKVIPGRLTRIETIGVGEMINAELELAGQLPEGTSVGAHVNGFIEVGELQDVVFFERPGDSHPYTESMIFVLEPDGEHARRTNVRYGRQSGSLMEIISGLSPGDRVIVTAFPGSTTQDRVRLK